MRRILFVIIFVLSACGVVYSAAQNSIIRDVRGEISDDSAKIIIEANYDIDYVDYTLPDPPRLIIDPIGKVYSDLKEVITFNAGPIKKITVVKGKPEPGLTGNFYPLDFISIESSSMPEYKTTKEIKEEVIVEIMGKEERAIPRLLPEPEERDMVKPEVMTRIETSAEEKPEPLSLTEAVEEKAVPLQEIKIEKAQAERVPQEERKLEVLAEVEQTWQGQEEQETAIETTGVIPLPGPKAQDSAALILEPPKMIYRIGEGDTLDISVWQHPELDRKVIVRPDGFISFPLVGDLKAAGLTPPDLSFNVKENLTKLIKDPQVTVIVSGFGSKNIFVLGEVTKPGIYSYRGGMTLLDAISQSGGWKNSAVLNSVMLVRKVFSQEPEAYRLDVYAIIKKGDFSQNISVGPGDIIYVPKSFIANIGGFIENLKISIGAYITETTRVFD
jgi:polysaccharide biosynthesis/export protein